MNILHTLGLMTRKEHEAVKRQNDGLLRDIKAERQRLKEAFRDIAYQSGAIADLRPDALLWRTARDKRAARKGAEK